MTPHSAIEVANFFIKKSLDDQVPRTNLALQKIVFFAHANASHNHSVSLVTDPCMAWPYGPIFVSLYEVLKEYENSPVDQLIQIAQLDGHGGAKVVTPNVDDPDTQHYLETAWNAIGHFSAGKLVSASHQKGGAWFETVKKFVPDPTDTKQVFSLLPRNVTILEPVIRRCGR